jgi:hypothetical protein
MLREEPGQRNDVTGWDFNRITMAALEHQAIGSRKVALVVRTNQFLDT